MKELTDFIIHFEDNEIGIFYILPCRHEEMMNGGKLYCQLCDRLFVIIKGIMYEYNKEEIEKLSEIDRNELKEYEQTEEYENEYL